MKLKLKETPEQIELIRAMGSKDKLKSLEALQIFAAFVSPVAQKLLEQAGTSGLIYRQFTYDEDDSPSIPLDLYLNTNENHIQVWQQNMAGGLPSSHVSGTEEFKIATFRLDSAVNWLKKYARRARLDVVSAAITRMTQEVLLKKERNFWAVIMKALGEATHNGADHLLTSTTQDELSVHDFNRLMTLGKRINSSWAGGTPTAPASAGITDLFISPEIMEEVRSFAYQPMNTRAVPDTAESTAMPLPDSVRERIFNSAGNPEIYNKTLHELNELGTTQRYNVIFEAYAPASVAHGSGTFDQSDEIIVGLDLSLDQFVSPVAKNADTGATFTTEVDDQFLVRSEKQGLFGSQELGAVCIETRGLAGLIV